MASVCGKYGKAEQMKIIPSIRTERFEQLEPGDLFLYMDHNYQFYALKTQKISIEDRSEMVLLGPNFPERVTESFLLPWQAVTTLSFGKNYSILLSTDAASWSMSGPNRRPVCLAIAEGKPYICTNGGHSPSHFFQCFVDMTTGAVIERMLPGHPVFTNTWEIAVLRDHLPPQSIIKYPLQNGTT